MTEPAQTLLLALYVAGLLCFVTAVGEAPRSFRYGLREVTWRVRWIAAGLGVWLVIAFLRAAGVAS